LDPVPDSKSELSEGNLMQRRAKMLQVHTERGKKFLGVARWAVQRYRKTSSGRLRLMKRE